MKYIAFTVKGLESIASQEIQSKLTGVSIMDQGPKRIIFETEDNVNLNKLRTIDDIGFFLGSKKITNVESIINLLKSIDLSKVKPANGFSLTLSFASAGFIDKDLLIKALVRLIKDHYGWEYLERDHTQFDLRLFLDKEKLFSSVRLTEKPLFHRVYRKISIKGALRPTIAAAMILWASRGKAGLTVVDNFCGSGTILAEALLADNWVFGGDIADEAIIAAKQNVPNGKIYKLNALKTNWPNDRFDLAVSNLPWNKQVRIDSVTQLYQGTLKEYQRIVKPEGVICLLVGKPELLIKLAKQTFADPQIQMIKLGYLGQNPTIVKIFRKKRG